MSIARARALRGLQSTFRSSGARATPRVSAPSRTQLVVGRRYASEGGHGHAAPGSDMPWLVSSVVITVPACYFLLGSGTSADSGHHAEHAEEHAEHEEHEEKEDEAPQADTAPGEEAPKEQSEQTQESGEQKEDEAAKDKDTTDEQEKAKESEQDAKPSGSQGESQPKAPDANKKSGPPETEGAEEKEGGSANAGGGQRKGPMKEDSPGQDETRKREPDSKGAYKKRVDSGLQKDLGGGSQQFDDPEGVKPRKESSQPSKPPLKGSEGDISGKQFGISNTPTRHSHQIDQDPEKSKKPEGGPDSAKAMGPVDPNRPAS